MLRFLWCEAARNAARKDDELKRFCRRKLTLDLVQKKGSDQNLGRLSLRVVHKTGAPHEPATFNAMHGAIPSLLGGLLNYSSNREGANSLAGMIRDGRYSAVLDNPAALFGGGSVTSSMSSMGRSLIGGIFGNNASSITDALASSSGVKPSSVSTLMFLLAPLTLGVVGKLAGSQGLNAAGITNLLKDQKREITDATPSEVSHILGFGRGPVSAPAPSALYVHEERATPTALLLTGCTR